LAENADRTKKWTEKIVADAESVLQPNPSTRVEDYLFEKIDKRRDKERMRNLEWLGGNMIDGGVDFGSGTVYGSALIKVGQCQQRLGETERDFVTASYKKFIGPLKSYLDHDMRTITKERKILDAKRLDLDAAKSRLRKAKTAETQASAEQDLKICQEEFERQVEVTRLLLENVQNAYASHVRHLSDFVESQIEFYAKSHQHMCDLQRELAGLKLSGALPAEHGTLNSPAPGRFYFADNLLASDLTSPTDQLPPKLPIGKKRARVLFDYEARNANELSLVANEVLIVSQQKELDMDWMMGERGATKGKVPVAYLEILS
jgi:endophilin-B